MPPRYAYWTILVDDQPTAFRSGSQEDLMPTFKRLQSKHASAKMMWWQNGKLWNSRLDAQEAMLARGEIGRGRDPRQQPALSERRPTAPVGRRESKGDRAPNASERREERNPSGKLDWKPKSQAPSPKPHRKPEWKPKSQAPSPKPHGKPEWKPKGSFKTERPARSGWNPKPHVPGPKSDQKPKWKSKSDWKPRGAAAPKRAWAPKRDGKLEWKPKGESTTGSRIPDPGSREKRKWIPKDEYKRSQAPSPKSQAPRDKNWRPGGEHKDPRQKYKDAKKAKWGRFKQTIRKRAEAKRGKPGKH